ncbi:hypothetical protein AAMO2058_001356600 [Amorphochlora amoebiformis]
MAYQQIYGVAIEVVGTSVTTFGLNLMKLSTIRSFQGGAFGECRWWGAFMLFVLGQILESLALYFCTQTVMATASNFAFVANAVGAWWLFGEKFTITDFFGTFCMIVGTIVVLLSAPEISGSERFTIRQIQHLMTYPGFVSCVTLQLVLILGTANFIVYKRRAARVGQDMTVVAVSSGVLSACLASMTITFSKMILLLLQAAINKKNFQQFLTFGPWLYIGVWGLFQILTVISLNDGMKRHDSLLVVPIYTSLRTLLVVLTGLSLYQLWGKFSRVGGGCFALGLFTCILSVIALHTERQREHQQREITKYWNIAYEEDDEALEVEHDVHELKQLEEDKQRGR